MTKEKTVYACSSCGGQSIQWRGQCPHCREWNTLEPVRAASKKAAMGAMAHSRAAAPVSLESLTEESSTPLPSGIPQLDRLLGGGVFPGGALLLGGAPGIGKSTLLLQLVGKIAAQGRKCLYVSGEESLGQLRSRAERLGALTADLEALATSNVDDALAALENGDLNLIIVDSVQTLSSSRTEGLPGGVSQVRAVATELVEAAKKHNTTLLLVGHVTKDGAIAGPKLLEHMVDTVLSMESDRQHVYRLLRVLKNRFGPSQELLVFRMDGNGLHVVDDPSTLFLGERTPGLSGAAVIMTMDGQRPFAVEVQALASRSFLSIPRRTSLGFDVNRLHLLLAVLEKRLSLNLGGSDIYAKIGGGLRMQDPGMDLGLVAAVLSSFYDVPLPERAMFWGEVDLNGQIRPVFGHETRLKQAEQLGYTPIFHPKLPQKNQGLTTLADLQEKLFNSNS